MKQNNEIRFKCSTEEKEFVRKKAESIGMSVKSLILYLVKNSTLKVVMED